MRKLSKNRERFYFTNVAKDSNIKILRKLQFFNSKKYIYAVNLKFNDFISKKIPTKQIKTK